MCLRLAVSFLNCFTRAKEFPIMPPSSHHDYHFIVKNTFPGDTSLSLHALLFWARVRTWLEMHCGVPLRARPRDVCVCVCAVWQTAGMEHIPEAACPAHASTHSAYLIWRSVCVCSQIGPWQVLPCSSLLFILKSFAVVFVLCSTITR